MNVFTYFKTMLRLIFRYSTKRIINLFAVIAILLSITNLFTVNAVFKGFHEELSSMFRGSMADYNIEWQWFKPELEAVDQKLKDWEWAPLTAQYGIIEKDGYFDYLRFKGVDPDQQKIINDRMGIGDIPFDALKKDLNSKQNFDPTKKAVGGLFGTPTNDEKVYPLIIGKLMSEQRGYKLGDRVSISVIDSYQEQKTMRFEITGIFNSGIYHEDRDLAMMPIEVSTKLQDVEEGFSTIQVIAKTDEDQKKLEELFPNAMVTTWLDKHGFHLSAVAHEQKMIAIIMSLIVIVSSFAILAIQWSFVQEKISDIGILRALGFSTQQIFTVFIGVSWVIGLTGLILGLGSGYLISTYANELIELTGWNPLPKDMFYHEKVPVHIEFSDMIWISILSLCVTTVAGLIPAWRAVRVEPIQAMTHD